MLQELLHLTLIEGIGPVTIKRLLQLCPREALYDLTVSDMQRWGFAQEVSTRLVQGLACRRALEREQELIERHRIILVSVEDERYPAWLSQIQVPPVLLWIKAQNAQALEPLARGVALVGARAGNEYGKRVVELFVCALHEQGWGTVSGGARGIDGYVHIETLRRQGYTCAVLGSGLLRPYPAEHVDLFARITDQGGAVISAFPLETKPLAGNFPARNRIIAGLCKATVVVQAAVKSGALITASYALHEGRDVGAVPGSLFDPLSQGCHALLEQGATPLYTVAELLRFVGKAPAPEGSVYHAAQADTQPAVAHARAIVSVDDDPVLHACTQGQSFEAVLARVACTPEELHGRLWDLQLEGRIVQTAGGLWQSVV